MLEQDNHNLSISRQCRLLGLCRSSLYYKRLMNSDSILANLIKEVYLDSDCRYGYRKITAALNEEHQNPINHKRVLRIMQEMGIQGLYPRKSVNTTIKDCHRVFPYLLSDLSINSPNQVWATDITYISLPGRFMYFIAIIDVFSRYILAYELSSSLEATFCINTLKAALDKATPSIFNTDQGSQFTSNDFVNILLDAGVQISMDHKGRCFDNIFVERLWRTLKQEAIYYYRPETVLELDICINRFISWYNYRRKHQSLGYKVPAHVYFK